jgi:threonine dehydrogenase-like Zn-dependent dehydrogenase
MTLPSSATVVYLAAPRQVELRREPLPALGDRGLLCETIVSAISPGTELAAYAGLPPLRAGVVYPRLQGYCNVGRVLAAGPGVKGIAVGDRVLSFTSHRSHFHLDASEVLLRLPDDAKADDLACTYLFHLGYNAVLRSDVRPGSRVLVIGLGALGLTSIAMASRAGAHVVAVSDQERPAQLARQFGARAVHGRSELPALAESLGDTLADVVITTTNRWSDWGLGLKMAGLRGVVAVLGFPGRGEAMPQDFNPLDSQHFYMKQLRLEAVGLSPEVRDTRGFTRFNERDNLRFLASDIIEDRLRPSLLVSGTYPGPDIERAYQDLLARRDSPITYLLSWNQD